MFENINEALTEWRGFQASDIEASAGDSRCEFDENPTILTRGVLSDLQNHHDEFHIAAQFLRLLLFHVKNDPYAQMLKAKYGIEKTGRMQAVQKSLNSLVIPRTETSDTKMLLQKISLIVSHQSQQ